MTNMKLVPSQLLARELLLEKIKDLGSRNNLIITGYNGVGKSFLGKYLSLNDDFYYVDLVKNYNKDFINYQETTNHIKAKDISEIINKYILSNTQKEKYKGIIIDTFDLFLQIYIKNELQNSKLEKFLRHSYHLPVLIISSLVKIFSIESEGKKANQLPILDNYEEHIVEVKFTKDDSRFFTEQILNDMPVSTYTNFYEILNKLSLKNEVI